MVTGASNVDVSLILVDARKGLLEQSRRHAAIASLLGVPHLVACINKMDLVDYDEAVFARLAADFEALAAQLEVPTVTVMPMSGLRGDNVVEKSSNMPWYTGPSLLSHLEEVPAGADAASKAARLPVQWVIRSTAEEDYRGYAGQVASGALRRGDEVVVEPSGLRSRIRRIDTYDGPVDEAFAPMSITVLLEDKLDVSRGEVICHPASRPSVGRELEAMVCWMADEPAVAGTRYAIHHATSSTRAVLEGVLDRLDVHTLEPDRDAHELGLNDIGRVALRLGTPLAFDSYAANRETGGFILIDEATNDTVGAGTIVESSPAPPPTAPGNGAAAVTWDAGTMTRERRWRLRGQRGLTVWLTGLPAAGKSTLASALEERLLGLGLAAYRLDGDNLRHGLNSDIGFDRAARAENVRRTGEVAKLLAEAGTVAVVSLVSPYADDRDAARASHERDGLTFIEVWVDTPLEECERRDPKGLYERSRRGELRGLTGVDDTYEQPVTPDVRILGGNAFEHPLQGLLARVEAHTHLGDASRTPS